jgi:hypothetical protein
LSRTATAPAWVLICVGFAGLGAMRAAHELTYQPAPAVRVRWRDGTADWRRIWLEHKYRLVDRAAPEGLSYSYVLMDTSRANIEALVRDPEAADTNDIDRHRFEVAWDTQSESLEWMSILDRTPGIREPAVRAILAAAFALAVIIGVGAIGRSRGWGRIIDSGARALRRADRALRNG